MTLRPSASGLAIAAALAAVAVAGPARADDDDALVCDERHTIDPWQLTRRLSLDLGGSVPDLATLDAVDAVAGDEELEAAMIDELTETILAGDGFRLAVRRIHEAMLWPNIQNVKLADNRVGLQTNQGIIQASSNGRRNDYRPDTDGACGDFEHIEFDPAFPGQFRPLEQDGFGETKFGWREVEPYWAPGTTVQACVHEAQLTPSVGGVDCASADGNKEEACGCGEDLRNCYAPQGQAETPIRDSLREQLLRAIDDATAEGADYTDIVLATTAWQDGKIAFWKRHLAPSVSFNKTFNAPDPGEEVLDSDWSDAGFELVERGSEHAGVITMPGFLLKYQTGRGRANRFRQAFQCQSFEPPATTDDDDCSDTSGDLTTRCTCRYCHTTLEPLAIGFERFAEAGTTLLSDPAVFPLQDASCESGNDPMCRRFYVQGDSPRAGWLIPLEFADVHPDYQQQFESGPRGVVEDAIWEDGDPEGDARTAAGSFANCSARRVFTHFLRRDPNADEEATVEELAGSFAEDGFDYRGLIRAVVKLDAYRRIR